MQNSLFKKFLSFSFGSWISLIIGIVSTPVITRLFSPEEFGKFSMFTLALNISMIFIIFGTDQAFVRFFYEEKEENRKYLLKNTLKVPFFIYVIISIFIFIFRDEISHKLFNENNNFAIYLLIFGIFFLLIQRYSVLVLRMQQKGSLYSILQISLKLINFLALILFAYTLNRTFNELIYANIISIFMVSIIAIFYGYSFWNFFDKPKIKLKHSLKDIMKYSSPLVMTSLITWLFQSFDRIAIKNWNTMTELGIYAAAFKIIAILSILQGTFTTFWVPVAYENYENDKKNKDFFRNINGLVAIIMLSVAIGIIMFKDILILLLGSNFKDAVYIMPFLVFIPIMYTISETTVIGINFKKKVNYHIIIAISSSLVNIIGNYYLVPRYGGKGAAFSTGISYIVFFSLRTYFSEKFYKVGYNLIKVYFMLGLIVFYAFLNTFWSIYWSYNFLLGLVLLFILFIINFRLIKGYYILIMEKIKT